MGFMDKVKGLLGGGIKELVEPVGSIIDNIHTSDEEKLILRNEVSKLQAQLESKLQMAQLEVTKSYHQLMIAEQKSDSPLARSWRPIVGLGFTALLFLIYGVPAIKGVPATVELPEMFWVAMLGVLGITVYGRTREKINRSRLTQVD